MEENRGNVEGKWEDSFCFGLCSWWMPAFIAVPSCCTQPVTTAVSAFVHHHGAWNAKTGWWYTGSAQGAEGYFHKTC